jgi:hypothetical protein
VQLLHDLHLLLGGGEVLLDTTLLITNRFSQLAQKMQR